MIEKYWTLRENVNKAFDKWFATRENEDYIAYTIAKQKFEGYCVDILALLMEENADVLERLKNNA